MSGVFRLKLPATSANLGPGFDAIALAMDFYLNVEARVSEAGEFSLTAAGRNAEQIARLDDNLIVQTYRDVLTQRGLSVPALDLALDNDIPLGMGCGSSAAALLAGVALANHFGALGMDDDAIVVEASRREGHPDNVAACWLGGFTVSAQAGDEVLAATFAGDPSWRLLVVIPGAGLATKKARAMLPESYSKADAVYNVQRTSLLVAAFAQKRLELLQVAMQDRMHQPYREAACPLLAKLLPLGGAEGVAGVALSGAGPSVLMVLAADADIEAIEARVREAAGEVEVLRTAIAAGARELR